MTEEADAVGIARAADSWIAVAFDGETYVEAVATDEIGALWGRYGEYAERILVGVPIGLFGSVGATADAGDGPRPPERECDALAREVLGDRAQAIVTPPSREATRRRRFPAARRVHERTTGGELSRAAFEQSAAIAAVDELLQEIPESRSVLRGSHPALAFRAFAGEPLERDPATAGGYAERMRTLADLDRDAPPTVQSAAEAVAGAAVPIESVLDALALAYTARSDPDAATELRSLPPAPPTDPTELPMELVYRSATPL
ncbi:hypothetical protein GCM10028857_20620 [Salinarchaeum chitinilyticum]